MRSYTDTATGGEREKENRVKNFIKLYRSFELKRKITVVFLLVMLCCSLHSEEITGFMGIPFGTSRTQLVEQLKKQDFDVYDDYPESWCDCEKFNFNFLDIKCWHFVAYFENEYFTNFYIESDLNENGKKYDFDELRKLVEKISNKNSISFKEFSKKSNLSDGDIKSYLATDGNGHYIELTKQSTGSNIFIYGGLEKKYKPSSDMKLIGEITPKTSTSNSGLQNELSGTYLDYNDMNSGWVCKIFEGTIFEIYEKDLKNYNTDLKKQVFLTSEDSKKYIDGLKKIQTHIKTQGISYTLKSNWDDCSISNYDMNNKCFHVTFGSNLSLAGTNGIGLNQVIAGYYVPKIPMNIFVDPTMNKMLGSSEYVSYVYNWKVNDLNEALKIEDNLANIKIRIKLTISSITTIKGTGFANNSKYTISRKAPVADSFILEFFDSKTNQIYGSIKY